jgi:hypothetical protein
VLCADSVEGDNMKRFTKNSVWMALGLFAILSALFLVQPIAVASQGPNLLQNPGFELPHVQSIPGKENCFVAAPWSAWFIQGTEAETSQGYRFAPEYKGATRADVPGNRVRNGDLSQQWFHSYGNFQAGVLQQVSNIQVGSKLKFELWVLTWSCDNERKGNCGGAISGDPSPMHVRIGIDPKGGGDTFSPAIVWSPEQNAWDTWTHFVVEAVAQHSTVTVFVYSYPDFRSQDNNVYVDDASLVVVAGPPAPTRRPTNTPLPTVQATEVPPTPTKTAVPPTPTQVPLPTQVPTTVPCPTNVQCPACAPTELAKPTATCPPVVIPTPVTCPSVVSQIMSGQGLAVWLVGLLAMIAAFVLGRITGQRK